MESVIKSTAIKWAGLFLFFLSILVVGCGDPVEVDLPQEEPDYSKTKVYLLGTFHFAQTDSTYDVLNEDHQQSIAIICKIVEGLSPDKIFIERMPDYEYQNKMDSLYQVYRNRTDSTRVRRNEIWQIAFRVAEFLDHPKLYQCDHPGRYGTLYAQIREYAEAHDQMDILNADVEGTTKPLSRLINEDSLMQAISLYEYMRWLNSKEVQGASEAHYIDVFPRVGQTDVYNYTEDYLLGTQLTADWYRRNIYIYSKMINQLDYEEESIFLLIGNDHVPIIRDLFESNPHFEVVDTHLWFN